MAVANPYSIYLKEIIQALNSKVETMGPSMGPQPWDIYIYVYIIYTPTVIYLICTSQGSQRPEAPL